jgi:hypothetical protein
MLPLVRRGSIAPRRSINQAQAPMFREKQILIAMLRCRASGWWADQWAVRRSFSRAPRLRSPFASYGAENHCQGAPSPRYNQYCNIKVVMFRQLVLFQKSSITNRTVKLP